MNYTSLPGITLEQVQHFFEHGKDLQTLRMQGRGGAAEAKRLIREAIAQAQRF